MVRSLRVWLVGALFAVTLLFTAWTSFGSEFGIGPDFPPPVDPGPPDPGPPDPGPPDPGPPDPGPPVPAPPTPQPSGQVYATSAQLNLLTGSYTMYMLSNKFWPSIVPTDGGYASNKTDSAKGIATNNPVRSSDFRLVSYDESEGDGSWNHSTDDDLAYVCDRQVWFTGYGVGGNAHNAPSLDPAGASFGLGAAQFGIERQTDPGAVGGIFGEYTWGNTNLNTIGQSTNAQTFRLGLYRRREWDCQYYLVAGSLGVANYDSDRLDTSGASPVTANGDYDGWEGQAYVERGFTMRNSGAGLQPYVALHYIYLRQNAFTETGGGAGVDQDVGGIDAQSLRGILGARYQYRLTACLVAEVRAAWWHEFLDTNQVVTVGFTGQSGASVVDPGLDLGRDSAITGFGLNWQMSSCWSTYAAYDCHFNDRQVFHLGSGGVQYVW